MKADVNRSKVMERPGRHHEVESEVPDTTVADWPTGNDMQAHLRSWGVGLILLGAVHLMVPFLDPIWGVVIIAVGILNLLIRHRGMFIVNGIVLLLVGILNIFSGGVGFWTVFGGFQLVMGAQEIRKCSQYADVS